MTNRELETRYNQLKATWKNLVNANVELVDENKILKEEIERLNNIIKEIENYLDRVEMFATIDHVNIFSMSELRKIIKRGNE